MSRSPNILWICTDQQRHDTLGAYGNPFVHSPRLDAFAREGVLFEGAYCQSPVCTPSRASFLTGRYPRTTRCRQNGQDIPADERLVTRILKEAGYVGGLSGKLHLSVCNPTVERGTERRIADGYDEFHWSHHPRGEWATNAYTRWLHSQGAKYDTPNHPLSKYVQVGMPAELHQTTWCAQKAIEFMCETAAYDHPWHFAVNIFAPHHPFDPAPEYLEPYLSRLDEIPLPQYTPGELADKPRFQANDHERAYNTPGFYPYGAMTEQDHRMVRAAYWAMCDHIDAEVGRMLDTLDETGQRDNTIVIFMSDHGEMLGDHGIYLKGPFYYEQAVHVPLIIRAPGVEGGRRIGGLTELIDLAPTLLEAAGLPPEPGMQGRSLWGLLKGGADQRRDDVYSEYYNAMPWHKAPNAQTTMVRSATHKLVMAHGLGEGELYDLEADPTETRNLWHDPAARDAKLEMTLRLADRMAWTVDPLPVRRAAW